MCGLSGFAPRIAINTDQLDAIVRHMTDSLAHRGPDDEGCYIDPTAQLGLGFRRLAIQDVSACGHQPMLSASGRYVIAFNGEIYNFRELRSRLDGSANAPIAWRGHSDTEVILALVERVGIEVAVRQMEGMFAIALWDKVERKLWLVRDRLGKKPLYYALTPRGLAFASELKAILRATHEHLTISSDALNAFLRLGYVPGQHSIYEQCSKLPAAHLICIHIDALARSSALPQPSCYWSLEDAALEGQRQAAAGNFATQDDFERLLDDAVAKRMISDVDLGAFLSGGLDSSLVVARMAALSTRPPRTFSIAFEESRWNEAPYARAIAQALQTDHVEFVVTPSETLSIIPELPTAFDEPFADASMIPTAIVCRLARKHVTVALSGDGGDEFFGGYDRYKMARTGQRWASSVPHFFRPPLAGILNSVASTAGKMGMGPRSAKRMQGLAGLLTREPGKTLFQKIVTLTSDPARFTGRSGDLLSPESDDSAWRKELDILRQCMLVDARGFLIDDILVKVDRASMSTSLEVRAPLLDHRIIELAWRFRTEDLYEGERGKMPIRRALAKQLSPSLFERPKMGFDVPIRTWLRGPLRDWAEALLDPARLRREGYFHEPTVTSMWQYYLRNTDGWTHTIWCVLMYQAWLEALAAEQSTLRRHDDDGFTRARAGVHRVSM